MILRNLRLPVLLATVWLASVLLPLTVFATDETAPESPPDTLELSPCELFLPGTPLTAAAECGWYSVAENPAEPEGRQIRLHVARVPARGRSAKPDPLVFLAGGPGQAATEAWLIVAGALHKVNEDRDILLVDQRGTGQSNPLRCPSMDLEEALALDWEHLEDTTRNCLDSLDGDPRFYTTTIAMQDYDQVRAALGYEQVNLFGVSYGTRAAQVYLRQFPDRVRTVILDSVVPQTLALGTEHAEKLDEALGRVLEGCADDAACRSAYPDARLRLAELMQRLDESPATVTIDHPSTGQPHTMEFDREMLAATIRFLTYAAETQALLPLLIHEAGTTDDFSRLASQLLITAGSLTESIAQGMELSVVCAEDFPWFPSPDEGRDGTEYLLGDSMMRASRIQCSIWPTGEVPDGFHDPVESDVPALLLSGEYDPVTPPEYGDSVQAHLSNSLHLVARGQGHSVTGKGCLGDLVSEFIASASPAELDTSCIERLQPSPWFMSLTGPEP
ncbi:alpha/beta hydrolase [Elongatibacter sediminis]|uniref:Alpha/beta hydrolase n=1 Tax=Elongatibacter sediminis TaxID=3119006 RepID=A0AAW9RFG5_9GAMM